MIPWDTCFISDCVEQCWLRFKDLLLTAADQSIPTATIRSNKKRPSWLSDETIKTPSRKHRAYIKSKRTQSLHDIEQYKAISRVAKTLTKRDHRSHMRGGSRQIPDLHHQGNTMRNTKDKCTTLNNYFTSVFTKFKSNNLARLRSSLNFVSPSLTKATISEDDTLKVLRAIDPSKSCGADGIPWRLLCADAIYLSRPLTTCPSNRADYLSIGRHPI